MKKLILTAVLGIYLVGSLALPAGAAAVYFSNGSSIQMTSGVNQWLTIRLDSQADNINTVGGMVTVPDNLKVVEVRTGYSFIDLWMQRPAITQKVPFSGVKLGGLVGSGELFSIRVTPQAPGNGTVKLDGLTVLAHDGQGTAVSTSSSNLNYTIKAAPTAPGQPTPSTPGTPGTEPPGEVTPDTTPPEKFIPLLSRNPDIFNGQWFLVFDTTDKESGIAKYQVREGDGEFRDATSPYLVLDQNLNQKITVRAIDNAGNIRDADVKVYRGLATWTGPYAMLGLLLLLILLAELFRLLRNMFSTPKPIARSR